MLEYFACTAKGTGKHRNESRIMINNTVISQGCSSGTEDEALIAVICDAEGGEKGGDTAAELTANGFVNFSIHSASALSVMRRLHAVNREILMVQRHCPNNGNMKTSSAGVIIYRNRYMVFNVGDTRCYRYSENSVSVLTKIQTVGTYTSCLGGNNSECFPYVRRGTERSENSVFLLHSGGTYKPIVNEDISEIFSSVSSVEDIARAIQRLATQNGSADDISVVAIRLRNIPK